VAKRALNSLNSVVRFQHASLSLCPQCPGRRLIANFACEKDPPANGSYQQKKIISAHEIKGLFVLPSFISTQEALECGISNLQDSSCPISAEGANESNASQLLATALGKRIRSLAGTCVSWHNQSIAKSNSCIPGPIMPEPVMYFPDSLAQFEPNHISMRSVKPGQGIVATCDSHARFGDVIAVLVTGSCGLELTETQTLEEAPKPNGATDSNSCMQNSLTSCSLSLMPWTLVLLCGDARLRWALGVARKTKDSFGGIARKRSLFSLVYLRSTRPVNSPCRCGLRDCDNQLSSRFARQHDRFRIHGFI
jgi:hypothetical protein